MMIKRVQTIKDIWLLSEIMNYTESGNFDRISGHIGAIGLLHYLEKNYIYPKGSFKKREENKEEVKQEPKKIEFFRNNKKRTFFNSQRRLR